jgi:heptosyltransferase-3
MFIARSKRRISYGITGGSFLLTDEVRYKDRTHEVDRNMELARALGVEETDAGVDLVFFAKDSLSAGKIIKDLSLNNYAVIHPIPGHVSKRWDLGNFLEVAKFLAKDKEMVPVLVGSKDEARELESFEKSSDPKCVNIAGMTNLGELYHIISKASLFVGVDSSPAHMAAAAGVPAIVLFSGVNDPLEWAPRGRNVRLIFPGEKKDLAKLKAAEVCGVINEVIAREEKGNVW